MQFETDDVLGFEVAAYEFKGTTIKIRLFVDDGVVLEEIALHAVDHVFEHWTELQSSLAEELFKTYNDEWADPERGRPRMTRGDFLNGLMPETIDYDCYAEGEESYTMYFSESGMFGNHGIQVCWSPDIKPIKFEVCIIG